MLTASSPAEPSPDGREGAVFLDLDDQVLDRFPPNVMLSYGGHPASLERMRRARARGLAVDFQTVLDEHHRAAARCTVRMNELYGGPDILVRRLDQRLSLFRQDCPTYLRNRPHLLQVPTELWEPWDPPNVLRGVREPNPKSV